MKLLRSLRIPMTNTSTVKKMQKEKAKLKRAYTINHKSVRNEECRKVTNEKVER
jgi:hypothetical protein